jgi:hypothetical protein
MLRIEVALDFDRVFPAATKVVMYLSVFVSASSRTSNEARLALVERTIAPIRVGSPSDIAGTNLMEVTVGPAHRGLDRKMQTIAPQCQRHLDAARDRWFDVVERDLEAGHSCRQLATFHFGGPVPGHQRGEIVDLVIGDPGEYVGKPSLRIDFVELACLNQREHHGGALATAIGAGEQP